MNRTNELLGEINRLPSGYLSKKVIHGREYFYRQWLEEGKIKSCYVREHEIAQLRVDLEKRKALEKELKEIKKTSSKVTSLRKRTSELTGSIMSEDTEVARFVKGNLTYINDNLCPMVIRRTGRLEDFLLDRPAQRAHADFHLEEYQPYQLPLFTHAVCERDNYWFKASGSKLKYKDIENTPSAYPVNKLSENEEYSNQFCLRLAESFEILPLQKETQNQYNIELLDDLLGNSSSLSDSFECLSREGKTISRDFIRFSWFNALVNNKMAAGKSVLILRGGRNGKIAGIMPNSDYSKALIGESDVLALNTSSDAKIKEFWTLVSTNKGASEIFDSLVLPVVNTAMVENIADGIKIKRKTSAISYYLMRRYEALSQ